jgi:hypothetical protein
VLFLVEPINLDPGEIRARYDALNFAALDHWKVAESAVIHRAQRINGTTRQPNCLRRASHRARQTAGVAHALGERTHGISPSEYPFQMPVAVNDEG